MFPMKQGLVGDQTLFDQNLSPTRFFADADAPEMRDRGRK